MPSLNSGERFWYQGRPYEPVYGSGLPGERFWYQGAPYQDFSPTEGGGTSYIRPDSAPFTYTVNEPRLYLGSIILPASTPYTLTPGQPALYYSSGTNAHLICKDNGNLLDPIWYKAVNAGLVVGNNYRYIAPITTSWSYSNSFSGDNSTVQGICLHFCKRASNPTGQIEIVLYNVTNSQTVASVTCNVSSFSPYVDNFVAIYFQDNVTIQSGKSYRTYLRGTVDGEISVVCNGYQSISYVKQIFIGTKVVVPESNCTFYVIPALRNGQWTNYSVNVHTNTITARGGLHIGGTCQVTFPTDRNTWLRLAGDLFLGDQAQLSIGTPSTPVGAAYTAVLELHLTSNGQYRIYLMGRSSFTAVGYPFYTHTWALLSQDAQSGSSQIVVDRSTGWQTGDEVVLSGTGIDFDEVEAFTISSIQDKTITLSGSLSFTHLGTYPLQGEIINLRRNVILRTTSSSYRSNIFGDVDLAVDWRWIRVENFGRAGSWPSSGSVMLTSDFRGTGYPPNEIRETSSVRMIGCAFVVCDGVPYYCYTSMPGTMIVDKCVGYMINYMGTGYLDGSDQAPITVQITDNCFIGDENGSYFIQCDRVAGVISGNRFCNAGDDYGLYLDALHFVPNLEFYNNCIHTCYAAGLYIWNMDVWMPRLPYVLGSDLGVNIIYHCGHYYEHQLGSGLWIEDPLFNVTIKNFIIVGNGGYYDEGDGDANIFLMYPSRNLEIVNCIFGSTAFNNSNSGVCFAYDNAENITIKNCLFSPNSGHLRPHIIDEIHFTPDYGELHIDIKCIQCQFGGAPQLSEYFFTDVYFNRYLSFIDCMGTPARYGRFIDSGEEWQEAIIKDGYFYSIKLVPHNVSPPLRGARKFVHVPANTELEVSLKIRVSSNYNGDAPALILINDLIPHVWASTTIATFSGLRDTWQTLTGTIPSMPNDTLVMLAVQVNGTAGVVYVSDYTVRG